MAARTTGLGPTSQNGSVNVGAKLRLGGLGGAQADANALLVLVVLEMVAQILLRRGVFRGAHGG